MMPLSEGGGADWSTPLPKITQLTDKWSSWPSTEQKSPAESTRESKILCPIWCLRLLNKGYWLVNNWGQGRTKSGSHDFLSTIGCAKNMLLDHVTKSDTTPTLSPGIILTSASWFFKWCDLVWLVFGVPQKSRSLTIPWQFAALCDYDAIKQTGRNWLVNTSAKTYTANCCGTDKWSSWPSTKLSKILCPVWWLVMPEIIKNSPTGILI